MKKEKSDYINPMKELRNKLGMTQQQFSEKTGVQKTTITNIESGKHHISIRTQKDVAVAFNLYDDWYTGPNFDEKINIDETMKDILKLIMNNVDNEMIARHILQNFKMLIDTEGLSKEERKIYADYIYIIFRDLAFVATEAKKHIRNEKAKDIAIHADKVAGDIMNLPGIQKSKYIKVSAEEKSLLDDYSF